MGTYKFSPAIYEHKSALIGEAVAKTSSDATLLAAAIDAEMERYAPDYITVGIDIYNVEAEAIGSTVGSSTYDQCPDVESPLWDIEDLPEAFEPPAIPGCGRFQMMLDAAKEVRSRHSNVSVRVAATGPITLAAKLTDIQDLIVSLAMEDGHAERLLHFCHEVVMSWCQCVRAHNLDVILFDSMAAPPIFSPDFYERYALPLHKNLMAFLNDSGQQERELVIGGDTACIAKLLKQSGANILLCDYACEADAFQKALGDDSNLHIRRNVSPVSLADNPVECAERLKGDLVKFTNPIIGTGILPYHFDPSKYATFKNQFSC